MLTDFFQKEVPGELQNSLMGLLKTVILYLFYEWMSLEQMKKGKLKDGNQRVT